MRRLVFLLSVALLTGCGHKNDDVGGVSPEEDRMLNEAAASQDANLTSQPIGNDVADDQGNSQ